MNASNAEPSLRLSVALFSDATAARYCSNASLRFVFAVIAVSSFAAGRRSSDMIESTSAFQSTPLETPEMELSESGMEVP